MESNNVRTAEGKDLTEARPFNLMFSTQMGASADPESIAYLRPETAQSIFVQFKNVLDTSRKKLPFGIAQIGKAFRNEINPRNFTFRSREFEQMELEYFCRPEQGMDLLAYWLKERLKFYQNIGIARERLHVLDVPESGARLLFEGDLRHRIRISVRPAGTGRRRVSDRLRFDAASKGEREVARIF